MARKRKAPLDPLTQRLACCYTGAVHDVLQMMGELSAQTLAAR